MGRFNIDHMAMTEKELAASDPICFFRHIGIHKATPFIPYTRIFILTYWKGRGLIISVPWPVR